MSSSGVISHNEVMRSIYEFLSFHGYRDSLIALQAESGIPYNVLHAASSAWGRDEGGNKTRAVATREGLETAVMDGNWSEVLRVYTDGLLLSEEVRALLYETILEELLEVHGLHPAAKALFHNAPAFTVMRHGAPTRHARLERMLNDFDPVAWEERKKRRAGALSADTIKRRGDVLQSLQSAINFSNEPYLGRLPTALYLATHGNPRKRAWRDGDGDDKDADDGVEGKETKRPCSGAVRGEPGRTVTSSVAAAAAFLGYPLAAPRSVRQRYDCGGEANRNVSCCLVLPEKDDASGPAVVLVGRADGAVDFLDARTGTAVGQPASHSEGVLCMCLDEPVPAADGGSTWVAVGYRDGWVKVYNTESHKLVRRFSRPHAMGVMCVAFVGHQDPQELSGHHQLLLTGSYDAAIKLLSLAAGSVLATVSSAHHGTFVNALCALPSSGGGEDSRRFTGAVVSAGNDGTLAFWRVSRDAEALAVEAVAEQRQQQESDSGGSGPRRLASSQQLLSRIGSNMNLRALHVECRDAVATMVLPLPLPQSPSSSPADPTRLSERAATPDEGGDRVKAEILVLTRSAVALVLSLSLDMDPSSADNGVEQPVRPCLLCLLRASKPLRHVACVPWSASRRREAALLSSGGGDASSSSSGVAPMLSVYATTEEGTLLLYNVEMNWRDEQRWKAFGGAMVVAAPTDESPIVITEVGHAVQDVHVCPLPLRTNEAPAVVASAESLTSFYLLV